MLYHIFSGAGADVTAACFDDKKLALLFVDKYDAKTGDYASASVTLPEILLIPDAEFTEEELSEIVKMITEHKDEIMNRIQAGARLLPGTDYTAMIRDLIKKCSDSPLSAAALDDHLRRLNIIYRLARIYTDQEHRAVWDRVIAEATD